MKYFDWNDVQNRRLKAEREIGFESVVAAIEEGKVIDKRKHPNTKRYSHQEIFVVEMYDYVYIVPFVEDDEKIFLKTIIPSREETKRFLSDKNKKK